jgi:hypothetical protein
MLALANNHCPPPPGVPPGARYSCKTHTQTYQPGEPVIRHPGGSPGRRNEPADGGKGITRTPPAGQASGAAGASGDTAMMQAMDRCLRDGGPGLGSGLGYYSTPSAQAFTKEYAAAAARFDPPLDPRSTYLRSMLVAQPFAAHVVDLRARTFGAAAGADDAVLMGDEITGFLVRCLLTFKVIPTEDPRGPFATMVGADRSRPRADPGFAAQRKSAFWNGYQGGPLPLRITMRKAP